MTKAGLILLLIAVTGCTHTSVSRSTASTTMLHFECALEKESNSGIRISVPAADFKDIGRDVAAEIEIIKNGKVGEKASNALLGDRMPPTPNPGEVQPVWSLSANLGRSGKISMGYDFVNPSWIIIADTRVLNTGGKAAPAVCKVIDSSGMSH